MEIPIQLLLFFFGPPGTQSLENVPNFPFLTAFLGHFTAGLFPGFVGEPVAAAKISETPI